MFFCSNEETTVHPVDWNLPLIYDIYPDNKDVADDTLFDKDNNSVEVILTPDFDNVFVSVECHGSSLLDWDGPPIFDMYGDDEYLEVD